MDLDRLSRPSAWDLGNEVLYRLCAEYPGHSDPEVVVAKLWLIGRACAAPLERGRPMPGGLKHEDFYTGRVVPLVLTSPVDEWIDGLDGTRLTWGDLPRLLAVHSKLVELFREISGRAQRSLASKYLHFHRPGLFFIYDSRADAAVRSQVRRPPALDSEDGPVDAEYTLFARRCMVLLNELSSKQGKTLTPRSLDRLLLEY